MRFAILDVSGKGLYLQQRLEQAGHKLTGDLADVDVFIADCDWWWAHPRPAMIAAAAELGVKVALYPHGGQPQTFVYDGLTIPDPLIDVRLEHGPGQLELGGFFDEPVPGQRAVGWLFSPTASFQPVDKPKRVLFAPQHPNIEMLNQGQTNGGDPGPAMNNPVYRDLLALGFELTVSVVGDPWLSGIYQHPRARIIWNNEMEFQVSYGLVKEADVVVAAGTTAALGVALGKPTVMLGQTDLTDYVDGHYQEAAHADEYRDLIRYPLDAGDGDLDELIAYACAGEPGAAEWRTRYIGNDGTEKAVAILSKLGETRERSSVTTGKITGVAERSGEYLECEVCHTPKTGKQTRHRYCPDCAAWDAAGRPQRNVTIQGVTAYAGARSNWNEEEGE